MPVYDPSQVMTVETLQRLSSGVGSGPYLLYYHLCVAGGWRFDEPLGVTTPERISVSAFGGKRSSETIDRYVAKLVSFALVSLASTGRHRWPASITLHAGVEPLDE